MSEEVVGASTPQVITGYNSIGQEQLDAINTVKANEQNLAALWKAIAEHDVVDTDYDLMRQARDHFTTGYMFLVRAISDPIDPFSFHRNPNAVQGEVHGD